MQVITMAPSPELRPRESWQRGEERQGAEGSSHVLGERQEVDGSRKGRCKDKPPRSRGAPGLALPKEDPAHLAQKT